MIRARSQLDTALAINSYLRTTYQHVPVNLAMCVLCNDDGLTFGGCLCAYQPPQLLVGWA